MYISLSLALSSYLSNHIVVTKGRPLRRTFSTPLDSLYYEDL